MRTTANEPKTRRNLGEAVRDPDFLRYLAGLALITLGTTPLASFLPLFLEETVGLTSGNVVLVQNGTLVGALLSSYLWGWATDRYGSRPVMLTGVLLFVLIPLLWWVLPRHAEFSLVAALVIAFVQGIANLGWGIGATKLLFVSVVPAAKKMDYLALWFAWAGITAGVSQVVGGWILEFGRSLHGSVWTLPLDAYTPLLVIGSVAPLLSLSLLGAIRDDSRVSMGQFAGIFLRGNPVLAMSSLVRYHIARDEHATVVTTARLGQANSLLAVDELLEALADPRFNVRFEAILAIARMKPEPRLIAALGEILAGNNPSLSVIAAWALGRIGAEEALDPLRQGLEARYRSIQAHSARALGVLGDIGVIPRLLKGLRQEPDEGLRVAYASALGTLRASSATETLLVMLQTSADPHTRLELALALARIVGNEQHFIQLWRQGRSEAHAAAGQAVTALKKRLVKQTGAGIGLAQTLDLCAEALARGDDTAGLAQLAAVIEQLAPAERTDPCAQVLTACAQHLISSTPPRAEYLLLALHALETY